MNDLRKLGLDPVIDEDCQIVILGSLPGDDSLRLGQYYAHKGNQFWTILGRIFEVNLSPIYARKVEFLLSQKIGLWDVLKCADRAGSSDGNLRNEVANDFAAFFSKYARVRMVGFNGTKAEAEFNKRFGRKLHPTILSSIRLIRLPSTSPTPGKYVRSLDEKLSEWKIIRDLVTVRSEASGSKNR